MKYFYLTYMNNKSKYFKTNSESMNTETQSNPPELNIIKVTYTRTEV